MRRYWLWEEICRLNKEEEICANRNIAPKTIELFCFFFSLAKYNHEFWVEPVEHLWFGSHSLKRTKIGCNGPKMWQQVQAEGRDVCCENLKIPTFVRKTWTKRGF